MRLYLYPSYAGGETIPFIGFCYNNGLKMVSMTYEYKTSSFSDIIIKDIALVDNTKTTTDTTGTE